MQLLTAREASNRLNIRLSRVYELVRSNIIPHVRLGRRQIRFDPELLTEWIKQGGAATTLGTTRQQN